MRILAADTSTSVLTLALCDDDRLLVETIVECGRTHTERLMSTLQWLLDEAGMTLSDVDALAISSGPGSFTGLRVGVAAWKGLAFGTGLPLVAVPTLDAMTRLNAFHNATVCPLLDAKMGEVFGATYEFRRGIRRKLTGDLACPVEHILDGVAEEAFFLGDGAALYADTIRKRLPEAVILTGSSGLPRAAAVAAEGRALLATGASGDPATVAPEYLRSSQPEKKHQEVAKR